MAKTCSFSCILETRLVCTMGTCFEWINLGVLGCNALCSNRRDPTTVRPIQPTLTSNKFNSQWIRLSAPRHSQKAEPSQIPPKKGGSPPPCFVAMSGEVTPKFLSRLAQITVSIVPRTFGSSSAPNPPNNEPAVN